MKRILLFIAAAFAAVAVYGQDFSQLPQLPNDPAVRTGKLDNGLTYYITYVFQRDKEFPGQDDPGLPPGDRG